MEGSKFNQPKNASERDFAEGLESADARVYDSLRGVIADGLKDIDQSVLERAERVEDLDPEVVERITERVRVVLKASYGSSQQIGEAMSRILKVAELDLGDMLNDIDRHPKDAGPESEHVHKSSKRTALILQILYDVQGEAGHRIYREE